MELGTRGDCVSFTGTGKSDAAFSGFHRMPTEVILQTVAGLITNRGCLLSIAKISDSELLDAEAGSKLRRTLSATRSRQTWKNAM
jgi:hypothetical protein